MRIFAIIIVILTVAILPFVFGIGGYNRSLIDGL